MKDEDDAALVIKITMNVSVHYPNQIAVRESQQARCLWQIKAPICRNRGT